MRCRRIALTWLGVVAAVVSVDGGRVHAQSCFSFARPGTDKLEQMRAAAQVPLDEVPAHLRESIRIVLARPTLFTRGPAEMFPCRPAQYYWLLEHPDRAMLAWLRLGAKCLPITARGDGRFGWVDDQGSDFSWETVYHNDHLRVWYAEGKVRPAPMLPLVPVRSVVMLRHVGGRDEHGGEVMHHQADIFLQTDSRTAFLVMKMLGASAPRLAQEGAAQLQLFFAGLAWYLERHPERADTLLLSESIPAH
jgi:hypothetical protein